MELRRLVGEGRFQLITGFRTNRVALTTEGVLVTGATDAGDRTLRPVDEVIVATGGRPDLSMQSELRLDLDPAVESPKALAPLIDPNLHSCGTVRPHGEAELRHPDQGFYIVGSKSYGRAPTFLMLTGYEQVRSIAAALSGDWAAARDVQVVLPETGVCSGGGESGCCGPTAAEENPLFIPLLEDVSSSGAGCGPIPSGSGTSCCAGPGPAPAKGAVAASSRCG